MWCQLSVGGWCICAWLLAVRATSLQRQALEIDTRGHLQKVSDEAAEDGQSKFKHHQLMRKAKGRGLEQLQAEALLMAENSVAVVQQFAAENALAHSSGRAAPLEGEQAIEQAVLGTRPERSSMPAGKNTGTEGKSKVSCDCMDGGGADMAAAPLPIGTRCEHRTDGAGDLVALIVPEVCYQQSLRDTMISCVDGEAVITVFLNQDCTGIKSAAPLMDIDCRYEPDNNIGHTAEWACEAGVPALEYTFFSDAMCKNRIADCNDAALNILGGKKVADVIMWIIIILAIIVLVFGSGVFYWMTGYWPWQMEAERVAKQSEGLGKWNMEDHPGGKVDSSSPNLQTLEHENKIQSAQGGATPAPVPSEQPLLQEEDEGAG